MSRIRIHLHRYEDVPLAGFWKEHLKGDLNAPDICLPYHSCSTVIRCSLIKNQLRIRELEIEVLIIYVVVGVAGGRLGWHAPWLLKTIEKVVDVSGVFTKGAHVGYVFHCVGKACQTVKAVLFRGIRPRKPLSLSLMFEFCPV